MYSANVIHEVFINFYKQSAAAFLSCCRSPPACRQQLLLPLVYPALKLLKDVSGCSLAVFGLYHSGAFQVLTFFREQRDVYFCHPYFSPPARHLASLSITVCVLAGQRTRRESHPFFPSAASGHNPCPTYFSTPR